jgi:hypothetical protein
MSAAATTGVIGSPRSRTYQAQTANMGRGLIAAQGATDTQVAVSGANAEGIGIVQESTLSIGDPISITLEGEAYAVIGAPVNAGQYVISDASGRAVPSTAVGDNIVGRAISSGSAANDEIVIYVNPFIR